MAGFNAAPTLIKVTFILVIIAFILHIIGFFTPYWQSYEYEGYSLDYYGRRYYGRIEGHSGLWRGCSKTGRYEVCGKPYRASWFEAVQAFETIGFIAAIAALVLIVLYIFVPATSGKRIVFILTMLACFAAAGCIILGIIIYGAKVENNLSWSFALCTIAGIIFGICGILLVVDMLKR